MKLPIWSTICTVFFCYYFLSFKTNVFKIYYDTTIYQYVFNETIRITICSPLKLHSRACLRGRKLENKNNTFDCKLLKQFPLECLTKDFRSLKASTIIRTIRKCDQEDIFGSRLRLNMYRKEMLNTEDIETNQNVFKTFKYDRNTTYLNNGDYCGSFVFKNFTNDPDSGKSSIKSKIYYQISIEKINSPIKIFVNQQRTSRTYFNFHQVYFRNFNDEFWRQKNEDLKNEDPDFLGGLETKNVTDDDEDYFDDLSFNNTIGYQTNKSSDSIPMKNSTSKQVQVARKYIPRQNITVYAYLLHTRIYKLESPYESNCLHYENNYQKINNKTVKSREMCLIECYKYYANYYKFLYTDREDIVLKYDIRDYSECTNYCQKPNCISDYFHARKYKATYNIGDGKKEQDEMVTKDRNDNLEDQDDLSRPQNHKLKLQFNEYINIVTAKPVFTPILAITYLFGLLNVFLGTNLLDFNRNLASALIDLKRLLSKITNDSSQPRNIFLKSLKLKELRELRELKKSKEPKNTNQISKNLITSNLPFIQKRKNSKLAPNLLKYNEVFKDQFDDKNRLRKLLNLKGSLNTKTSLEINQNSRKQSIVELKDAFKRKLSKRLEFITQNFKQDKLINLNRLFCFYLLLIYSIYSLIDVLVERSINPTVTFTDFLKSGSNSMNISVSFCFKLEDLLSKEINDEIYEKLNYEFDIGPDNKSTTVDYEERKRREEMYLNELYSNYNLDQLNNLTRNLTDIIDSIYLGLRQYSFSNEHRCEKCETSTNFTTYDPIDLNPEIFYFRNFKCVKFFLSKTDFFFIVEIEYSFVSFNFKVQLVGYFIEQGQEYPNRNSIIFQGTIDFQVRKLMNRYTYCTDFLADYGCLSQGDCQSKCIGANYTSKLQKLNVNHPIILSDENKQMHFDNETESSKSERQFHKGCSFRSKYEPCDDLRYYKFSTAYYRPKEVLIYLSNDIVQKRIENRFKNVEIVNYLLNIGSLIYDLNLNVLLNFVINLVLMIYVKMLKRESKRSYFNQKIKIRVRNILKFLKFIILLSGFLWHVNFVAYNYIYFNEAITSNLFDRPQNKIFIPNVTVCVGNQFHVYNETALKNSKFQGKTGKQQAKKFPSLVDVFNYVAYKDQDLNETVLDEAGIKLLQSNSNHKKIVYVSTYFLFESKCYTFSLSAKYDPLLFLTYNTIYPLRLYLKPLQHFHYSVFIHDRRKYSFKNYVNIERDKEYHILYEAIRVTFDAEITVRLYLNYFLRNEETYYFEDQADYFNFLLEQFAKEKNRTTTRLPLIEKYFDLEIDNQAFIDYYKNQHYQFEDDIFIQDLSYPVYKIISDSYDVVDRTTVQLDPLFLEQHVQYRSRLSFNEAVLYTGTLISFWLNTCYMGLTSFLRRFFGSVKYYVKQAIGYFR